MPNDMARARREALFGAGSLAGRLLWRRPWAPLILALLLLGWQLVFGDMVGDALARLLRAAWAGEALLPRALAAAAVALAWSVLFWPLLGFGLALVESNPAEAVPKAVAQVAGLGTIGLAGGLASAASQACLLAALLAATRRSWAGGSALGSALLWALPAGPALLLGALAGGASLLATARISAGDRPGSTPADGLIALGGASSDLLRDAAGAGRAFGALLIVTLPFVLGAMLFGMAGAIVHDRLASVALRLASALASAAALLWLCLGLRIALSPEKTHREPVLS
jgi:hypothetical protein